MWYLICGGIVLMMGFAALLAWCACALSSRISQAEERGEAWGPRQDITQ